MKNILILMLAFVFGSLAPTMASAKAKRDAIKLDYKMDYKRKVDNHVVQHEMKNVAMLKRNKWIILGKVQSAQSGDITLLMAKLLQRKKNKFKIQLMLVDLNSKEEVILEPQAQVLAGLPAKLNIKDDKYDIDFNLLVETNPR